jgi:hypothetical protein
MHACAGKFDGGVVAHAKGGETVIDDREAVRRVRLRYQAYVQQGQRLFRR